METYRICFLAENRKLPRFYALAYFIFLLNDYCLHTRSQKHSQTKLESYRSIQMSGKDLSADQRTAVSKYDAVISTLDFARDLVKQLQQFIKDSEKEQRKQARKVGVNSSNVSITQNLNPIQSISRNARIWMKISFVNNVSYYFPIAIYAALSYIYICRI